MKLVERILTKNPCYTGGRKMTYGVQGLMLHSVGCSQPNAMVFINSWDSPYYDAACVHGFIDANDGTAYQTLPWEWRGWHSASGWKGAAHDTMIGVEMCEPACIKYIGGATFTCSDLPAARAAVKRTYDTAVELFAYLCKKYNLDPLKDGVILSHAEGHARGIASDHGDPEHLWNQLGTGYTMDGFRKAVKAAMTGASSAPVEDTSSYTKIMGTAVATADQMKAYIKKVNPSVPQSVLDMIPYYLSEGKAEGVRGDIAFAQSCLETGNFGFVGSAVTLDQNNFCGMGVTQNGMKGNSFATPQLGIRGQIQHLKAYGSKDALKQDCIDPRFKYVTRGAAVYVEWLGIPDNPSHVGWAGGAGYGSKILTILKNICAIQVNGQTAKPEAATPTPAFTPYVVRVKIDDLLIRKGAGIDHERRKVKGKEQYTGKGAFTIIKEKTGKISSSGAVGKWGLLKAYKDNEDGWICLAFDEYTEKV